VSASVNLTLHHKVQKFSSGTGSPGWSRKRGRKTDVMCVVVVKECHADYLPCTISLQCSAVTSRFMTFSACHVYG